MKKEIEVILQPNGRAVRRTVIEEDTNIADAVATQLAAEAKKVLRNAFSMDGLKVNLLIGGNEAYAMVKLPKLKLLCPWFVTESHMATPNFCSGSDGNPPLPVYWPVPADMKLVFAARVYNAGTEQPSTRADQSCYLVSFDAGNNGWALPLPNLYADGAVCMGQFDGKAGDIQSAFALAYAQFQQSQWNSDLFGETKAQNAAKLFAFKVVDEKFVSQNPKQFNWQKPYCQRVETGVTTALRQLL
jgi:hypothetical protein